MKTLNYLLLTIFILPVVGCNENVSKDTTDDACSTATKAKITHFGNVLLNELSIDTTNVDLVEGYSVAYSSAWGHHAGVRFYMTKKGYFVIYKSIKGDGDKVDSGIVSITKNDWSTLRYIIQEFDFWEEPICRNVPTADGWRAVVQGSTKSKSRAIMRVSTNYDKIGSLISSLKSFGENVYSARSTPGIYPSYPYGE